MEGRSVHEQSRLLMFPQMESIPAPALLRGENHQSYVRREKHPNPLSSCKAEAPFLGTQAAEATGVGWWLDRLLLVSTRYLARNVLTEQ